MKLGTLRTSTSEDGDLLLTHDLIRIGADGARGIMHFGAFGYELLWDQQY